MNSSPVCKVRYRSAEEIISNEIIFHGSEDSEQLRSYASARGGTETEVQLASENVASKARKIRACDLPIFVRVDNGKWLCGHYLDLD